MSRPYNGRSGTARALRADGVMILGAANIAGPMVGRYAPKCCEVADPRRLSLNIGRASEQRCSRQWPFLARGSIAFPRNTKNTENYRADRDALRSALLAAEALDAPKTVTSNETVGRGWAQTFCLLGRERRECRD
jgi:hypothetical protein